MKKIIKYALPLLLLVASIGSAKNSDVIIVEGIVLSNSVEPSIDNNTFTPGHSVQKITNKDDIIFYRSNIAVINPTKKKYNIKLLCVDSKDNIIYKGSLKMSLEKINGHVEKNIIGRAAQHLGLDPKPGAMIKGQINPLVNNNVYYIKLYVENKLLGLTKFHYLIEK
jgi:hypothetical protein